MSKEDSDEEWGAPKVPKRPKKTDGIIHCIESLDALIEPDSLESCKSLVAAANSQQHTAILVIFSSSMQ